jgi:FKBP-type peptidyl-prolyl cis-trans isomerase
VRHVQRLALLAGSFGATLIVGCSQNKPAAPGANAPSPAVPAAPAPAPAPAPAAAPAAPAAPAPAAAPAAAPAPAPEAPKSEVVFDPMKPPAGWVNCHHNHCHKVGGGVGSYQQVMQEMGATRMVDQAAAPAMPAAPADVAAPPADAARTPSGLASKVLTPGGGGATPGPTSTVTVHYTGWTTDGKAFDSSVARGRPATFPLNRVIAGWTEGVQLMTVGEERRFWIPENLAYQGRPGKPQGMLVFDVELISIQ